ncbi:MAG: sunset domain-containing protein [Chloroflexota bacterium]
MSNWLHGLPGFRSGTLWKKVVASAGYALIALFLLSGLSGIAGGWVLGLYGVLIVVLIASSDLRSRLPLVGSANRLKAAGGWAVSGIAALALVTAVTPPSVSLNVVVDTPTSRANPAQIATAAPTLTPTTPATAIQTAASATVAQPATSTKAAPLVTLTETPAAAKLATGVTVSQPATSTKTAPLNTSTQVPTATAKPANTPIAAAPTSTPKPQVVATATLTPRPAASPVTVPQPTSVGSYPCRPGQLKGNNNSMIYHSPGQRDYERTYANVTCFDTAAQAEAAGFRAAQR